MSLTAKGEVQSNWEIILRRIAVVGALISLSDGHDNKLHREVSLLYPIRRACKDRVDVVLTILR